MRRIVPLAVAAALVLTGCADPPQGLPGTDPAGEQPPVARSTTIEVRAGDTWDAISSRIYGDGRYAERIARDNGRDPASEPAPGERVRIDVRSEDLELVRAVASARGSYNAGVEAMQQRGREAEAREAFERALDRAPHYLDARYNLGLVLIRLGEPTAAAEELRRVVEERPDDPDALYGLAAAYVHGGDDARALEPLERALAFDPEFLRARWTYALALQRVGRVDEAAAAWEAYLERDATSALADEAREHLRALRPGR